ncbi:MAG TPA: YfhO family protein [Chitinophagaceae bacterium]|nr:YfhO family protein [Chitinophagaceae bacterium]
MKNSWFKKLIPHGVAVLVFLVVAFIYCKPVLEGKMVAQHDVTHWKGSIQQSIEYSKTHNGVYPLWTNSMFSGMPTFQIGYTNNNKIPWIAHKIFSLGLPKPVNFFFLASICFYFLTVILRIRPVFGILGALAFAYATYNPVIIAVGHDTKMLSIAYMPALLASILLIYEKKYWLGAGLTALFTSVLITQNHPQIAYYFFLAATIMTIFFAVRWIRNQEWRHLAIALGLTAVAGLVGVLTNAVNIFSTYEYQKETIRGGGTALADSTKNNEDAKDGLTKDYALSYSMFVSEPCVMMVPRMFGGSSDHLEIKEEKSKAIEKVRSSPPEAQQFIFRNFSPFFYQSDEGELSVKTYWGGIGGTSGPPYVGAIICFLAFLGLFVLDNRHKWWIVTAVLLAIMMSWGSYFDTLNGLLYKHLPLYNKFRAPSMILVIPQLLLPLLGVMALNAFTHISDKIERLKKLKHGALFTAGVFVVLFMLYFSFDFMHQSNKLVLANDQLIRQPEAYTLVRDFISGITADRKAMMLNDIFRSFGFIAAAALLLLLFARNVIKPTILGAVMIVLIMIDVMPINSIYLNYDSYKDETENKTAFVETNADRAIRADKSFYRVFNDSDGPTVDGDRWSENITSYYHNSIGGYHPAKIRIYQDLIENKTMMENDSAILNMLNAKYFIKKSPEGQTLSYSRNDKAMGNAWLVKNISYVRSAKAELDSLDTFNPRETAIVHESFKPSITDPPGFDSAATISLVKNDNDVITYSFNARDNQFAVFSEVYYKSGWKAYIDGKEAPIVKVNYVLRGLSIPAGRHDIRFEFKPEGYYTGKKITSIFSIILIVVLAAGIFMEWRNRRQTALANRV